MIKIKDRQEEIITTTTSNQKGPVLPVLFLTPSAYPVLRRQIPDTNYLILNL